jgi:dihydrofolate synthase/folylpolyglutamate synthase
VGSEHGGEAAASYRSVEDALRAALEQADPADLVLVTGSLSMVAAAREALGVAVSDPRERELLLG